MINLRGHHLVCLHFFKNGHTEEFRSKLSEIIRRVKSGEDIKIIEGADDLCHACPYLKDNVCTITENAEEEIRVMDNDALRLLNLNVGSIIKWNALEEKIPQIVKYWWETYCQECEFRTICEKEIRRYLR